MNNITDKLIINFFNPGIILIIAALIVPLLAMHAVNLSDSFDPLIIYPIFALSFIFGIHVLQKAAKSAILMYLMLQSIIIWIFLDSKIQETIGISLKIYGIIFLMALLISIYHIAKNFRYLWSNFPIFRYLLIFFGLNIFYFIFYHSDFRQWASEYFKTWYFIDPSFKKAALSGSPLYAADFNQFSETQVFGMYLPSLTPLIAVSVALMTFHGLNAKDEFKKRIVDIIKYLSFGFLAYFAICFLCVLAGLSQINYDQGRLLGGFLGINGLPSSYISTLLLLFTGLKYYINNTDEVKDKNIIDAVLTTLIAITAILLLLFITKSSLIACGLALAVMIAINFASGLKLFRNNDGQKNIVSKIAPFVPVGILLILVMANLDFVGDSLTNILIRFSNIETLSSRNDLWTYYIADWADNLNLFNFIFGFGVDASRELAFLISRMQPSFGTTSSVAPHVHNYYLEIFYNYGLMAFIFLAGIFSILINDIKNLLSKKADKTLKLLSCTSFVIIIYLAIFYMSEVLRIPETIQFFSILGFLEAAKFGANAHHNVIDPSPAQKLS